MNDNWFINYHLRALTKDYLIVNSHGHVIFLIIWLIVCSIQCKGTVKKCLVFLLDKWHINKGAAEVLVCRFWASMKIDTFSVYSMVLLSLANIYGWTDMSCCWLLVASWKQAAVTFMSGAVVPKTVYSLPKIKVGWTELLWLSMQRTHSFVNSVHSHFSFCCSKSIFTHSQLLMLCM